MTISTIITLLTGIFQFPTALESLIKSLRATPAEQQQTLINSMLAEAQNFQKTGRPTWN